MGNYKINTISKETLLDAISKSKSKNELSKELNLSFQTLQKLLTKYDISFETTKLVWNKGLSKNTDDRVALWGQKRKGHHVSDETKSKIGDGNRNKEISTETREKISKTNKSRSKEKWKKILSKQYETKIKNNSFNTSRAEESFYSSLLEIFDINDVQRQYNKDERYPYNCDFYINSIDLFIELNITWTHGKHIFDSNNKNDLITLDIWKEKAKISSYYKSAIHVWTILDKEKQNKAKQNNLNCMVLYNKTDLQNTLNKLKNYKKEI